MTKCSSHNIMSPLESIILERDTELLSNCLEDFAFREAKRISEKYDVEVELVVAIVREWNMVELFLKTGSQGKA